MTRQVQGVDARDEKKSPLRLHTEKFMMAVNAVKFVRRTSLGEGEYRKNFRQIDRDVIQLLLSAEAKKVTSQMAAIYLALLDAPTEFWEREGVLKFSGEMQDGVNHTAWKQLVDLLGCGNSTASKAIKWLHEKGIIGYFSGKNGVGIRIFLNRAVSSIGLRDPQKNLRLVRTPHSSARAPGLGAPFNSESLENLEVNLNPPAPKNGGGGEATVDFSQQANAGPARSVYKSRSESAPGVAVRAACTSNSVLAGALVDQIRQELEPSLRNIAAQAAAHVAHREHERTREWLDKHGIPKATRVAQRETFNVLRSRGLIDSVKEKSRGGSEVGRGDEDIKSQVPTTTPRPLTEGEIVEAAEVCAALFEAQGRDIERTLADIGADAGGWVPAEDLPRVLVAIKSLKLAPVSAKG